MTTIGPWQEKMEIGSDDSDAKRPVERLVRDQDFFSREEFDKLVELVYTRPMQRDDSDEYDPDPII